MLRAYSYARKAAEAPRAGPKSSLSPCLWCLKVLMSLASSGNKRTLVASSGPLHLVPGTTGGADSLS